ncbi:MAG: hypothetical protein JF601_06480 [Acidobacteria bacterium]|nr:hypothetical protein [Acidobacteriota bacterium]
MNPTRRAPAYWYGYGSAWSYEYRSPVRIGNWPLLHVCGGVDPETLQPRVARGIIAIGNIAIGAVAIGGFACGLISIGGAGGAAFGLVYAVGGAAAGPAIIDAQRCDEAARAFVARWFSSVPTSCR